MNNKKMSQFVTKKSYNNIYFLLISILLIVLLGVVISKTITFFVVNTDGILNNSNGALASQKEFNMKAFEDLKLRRPITK
jgi:hypothetical protein